MPFNNFPSDWNYYEALGVSPTVGKKELIKAWRKLARKYHPDANKDPNAEETFKRINEAFRCLGNSGARQKYDDFLKGKSKSSSARTVQINPNPSSIELGKLAWNEQIKVVIDLISYEQHSLAEYMLDTQWVGDKPSWTSEIYSLDDVSRKMEQVCFEVDASLVDEGEYKAELEVCLYVEFSGELVDRVRIPVSFKVGKIESLNFKLVGQSGIIRLGPYQVGQRHNFQAIMENNGPPVWEKPDFEWINGTPDWATDVSSNSATGQVFPIRIGFSINTAKCDPNKNPYRSMIAVRMKGKTVGKIPVILEIARVSKPDVYPAVDRINFGVLAWCETKICDLKLVNKGDPSKQGVWVDVKEVTSGWLQVGSVEPKGEGFPKRVVVEANANRLSAGDYLAKLLIHDGFHTREIPVMVRVGPKPQLIANPAEIGFSWSDSERLSFTVTVDSVGGPAPYATVFWERVDYVAYDAPVIHGNNFPIHVHLVLRMDGYEHDRYRNNLMVSVSHNPKDPPAYTLLVPVVGTRK